MDRFVNARAAEIAASALGVSIDEIVSVEQIKHGLTNESWRVRSHDDVVVVRCSTADEDALRIDRASEMRILAAVAAAGIGAPIIQCDPAKRVLVTRYLGPPWSRRDAESPANIERIAQLLSRLHSLTPPAGVRAVDLAATVDGYLATLALHGEGGELASQANRVRAAEAAATLRRGVEPRVCHNDVHHLNVIDGGDLHLIDWEYAGVGEPLFDLASLCVYHRYNPGQRELLLSAYAASADASRPARLDAALWLFDYIRDLWMAVRAFSRK